MSFPWITSENFELGTKGSLDTETDTVNQLDVVHWKTLQNYPWLVAPYNGAYCARVQLTGGTADAYYTETSVDIADAATAYFKFEVWFSPTFTGTADDTFSIFELWGAASAVTGSIGARVVAATNEINFGIGSAASAAQPGTFAAQAVQRGVWYTVELKFACQTNGTGTADLYVTRAGDPEQVNPQISLTGKTNIVVTDGVLGIQDQLATTTGVILLDGFIMDDARIFPQPRYAYEQIITQSAHAFVGPGWVRGAAILSGTSPVVTIFDTNAADVNASQSYKLYFDSSNQTSIGGGLYFQSGCFVQMSGTNPVVQILLERDGLWSGVRGPLYYSDAGLKRLAREG